MSDDKYPNGRSIIDNPQPGDKAHVRNCPTRTVEKRFVDATDAEYVVYSTQRTRTVKISAWKKWAKRGSVTIK